MIKAIVYTSNAGHTKQYAQLLSTKISLPAYTVRQAKRALSKGDEIIYLGWLMAGKVKGYKKANRRFCVKALCGVGMAETGSQLTDIRKTNKLAESMPVFTLQGGFELDKLHGIYKLMMSVMQKTVGKGLAEKGNKTPEDEEFLELMVNNGNKVSEDNLTELILWYNNTINGGTKMEMKLCQSCGMPIESDDVLGTNKDGSINHDYCKYCYTDGEFLHDVSMEEFIEMCSQFGAQAGMTNEEMKELCTKLFPALKRWKKA